VVKITNLFTKGRFKPLVDLVENEGLYWIECKSVEYKTSDTRHRIYSQLFQSPLGMGYYGFLGLKMDDEPYIYQVEHENYDKILVLLRKTLKKIIDGKTPAGVFSPFDIKLLKKQLKSKKNA